MFHGNYHYEILKIHIVEFAPSAQYYADRSCKYCRVCTIGMILCRSCMQVCLMKKLQKKFVLFCDIQTCVVMAKTNTELQLFGNHTGNFPNCYCVKSLAYMDCKCCTIGIILCRWFICELNLRVVHVLLQQH